MHEFRLIVDQPSSGAWNMAADEWLLNSNTSTPVLRFYEWSEPTLSLGYFQSMHSRQQHPASIDCNVVRRASGGGAILHDHELTYSFAVPTSDRFARTAEDVYSSFHQTLISTLEHWNVTARQAENRDVERYGSESFLCFQRRSTGDVLLDDHKIAGSAQRRKSDKILQHGSVLLKASQFAAELPGINDLGRESVTICELIKRWSERLCSEFSCQLVSIPFSDDEKKNIDELRLQKFESLEWLGKR